MRIHYLQHVPFERLGYIETWLQENEHEISVTRFYEENHNLPLLEDIDALIVLGGPMNVYDESQYPWLYKEKGFIKEAIQSGKKVLGICLGAQLIAVSLGAKIHKADNREIGWFNVNPTEACKKINWLYDLFRHQPTVFHWHGDKFEIPDGGSANLLETEGNDNQAFYHSQDVIGLQFHLEVTAETLQLMIENFRQELSESKFIQTAHDILLGQGNITSCNQIMGAVLSHWLKHGTAQTKRQNTRYEDSTDI